MNLIDYQITIENTIYKTSSIETWTWYGELDKKGNKILRNVDRYASDTMLKLDNNNQIVGGYSFIFNDINTLKVYEVVE